MYVEIRKESPGVRIRDRLNPWSDWNRHVSEASSEIRMHTREARKLKKRHPSSATHEFCMAAKYAGELANREGNGRWLRKTRDLLLKARALDCESYKPELALEIVLLDLLEFRGKGMATAGTRHLPLLRELEESCWKTYEKTTNINEREWFVLGTFSELRTAAELFETAGHHIYAAKLYEIAFNLGANYVMSTLKNETLGHALGRFDALETIKRRALENYLRGARGYLKPENAGFGLIDEQGKGITVEEMVTKLRLKAAEISVDARPWLVVAGVVYTNVALRDVDRKKVIRAYGMQIEDTLGGLALASVI